MRYGVKIGWVAVLAGATAVMAGAQTGTGAAVRLSIAEGQVRISQAGADGAPQVITDQAVANTPLFQGYVIQTGDDGRAELQFDDGTIGRIPPDGTLALTSLQQGAGVMTLNGGMGYFELRGPEKVSFGSGSVVASGSATVRVKLDEAPGEVAVLDGNAHVEGPGGEMADLHGGESVRLTPAGGGLNVAELIEPDSWDAWNTDRDNALQAANANATPATRGFADSGNPAWGDLNANGNWYDVPGQGQVWSPYEASDENWDPYGNGYWMDSPNYGYTWVSGESWGYMPYQCGMWNWYGGFGWGWAPGVCSPWWGAGGGVWIVNVHTWPTGWRVPIRPRRPRGPVNPGGGRTIIAVRRQGPPVNDVLPLRDRRTPVTIAGATVVPQRPAVTTRPVMNRPVYNHQPARDPFGLHNAPVQSAMPGGVKSNYAPNYAPGTGASQVRPAPSSPSRPISSRPPSTPAPHVSAPPPAIHAAPPPPPPSHR